MTKLRGAVTRIYYNNGSNRWKTIVPHIGLTDVALLSLRMHALSSEILYAV